MMNVNLRDKVAVVTGGGSGIGRATALALAAQGAHVAVADIDPGAAADTAQSIMASGGRATSHQADVSDAAEVEELAEFLMASLGRVDILVNNAGVGMGGRFLDAGIEDWRWIVGVNFWGVVHGMHSFLPHMIARGSGHVVNVASLAGLVAVPGAAPYCATKHAVVGLSLSARPEMSQHGVGVTVVCPGVTATNIIARGRVFLQSHDRLQQADFEKLMRKRGHPPEKVARAILKGIRRNAAVVPVGASTWLTWLVNRLTVRGAQAAFRYGFARICKGAEDSRADDDPGSTPPSE